jgi:acetoin:2,6-dichlorophenolindophenol oxidoreductase subunit alpha
MTAQVTQATKHAMLKRMITIRRFEQEGKLLYRAGEIVGALHLYIGQEAVAVGACMALRDDDYATSTHRSHGHTLAKVGDLDRTMAEMMGRVNGLSKGRGGSMHMFDMRKGFLGGNGIVGGGIGIATGAALAAKHRGTDQVAVSFFSEGACNQGVLYETLNMAAMWKLPMIYLCENNQWAATTPVGRSTSTEDIAPRAETFGVPWAVCDGNDVMAVHEKVSEAVARARAGDGPTFIEAKTYRVEPHCGIIPDDRPNDEVDLWRSTQRDPIQRFQTHLLAEEAISLGELNAIEQQVEDELATAIAFARQSPYPDPATVGDGMWTD